MHIDKENETRGNISFLTVDLYDVLFYINRLVKPDSQTIQLSQMVYLFV